MGEIYVYLAGAMIFCWGIAHLIPTKSVVRNFGTISLDNQHIITMEWVIEGLTLVFIGFITIGIQYIDIVSVVSNFMYWSIFGMLVILTFVSLSTGFRVKFLPFKLCPFIFAGAAVLIILGVLL